MHLHEKVVLVYVMAALYKRSYYEAPSILRDLKGRSTQIDGKVHVRPR